MTDLPNPATLIRILRDRLELSIQDAKSALVIFEQESSSGLVHAACVVEARKFLVNVGRKLPDDEKAAARYEWDRAKAKSMAESLIERDPSLSEIDFRPQVPEPTFGR